VITKDITFPRWHRKKQRRHSRAPGLATILCLATRIMTTIGKLVDEQHAQGADVSNWRLCWPVRRNIPSSPWGHRVLQMPRRTRWRLYRTWLRAGAGVLAALALVRAFPAIREEARWFLARLRDSDRAYSAFVGATSWKSSHHEEALGREMRRSEGLRPDPRISPGLYWFWMAQDGSEDAWREYLAAWPKGPRRAEALERLDALLWPKATTANTVESYQEYRAGGDELPHAQEARQRQHDLRLDDRPFEAAATAGTAEAWLDFLEKFRGHHRTPEALVRLGQADPKSIFRLAREGKLAVKPGVDAVDEAGAVIGTRRPGKVEFAIPIGTYWRAVDRRVQDRVAVRKIENDVDESGPYWYGTEAVCIGMRKRSATQEDKFTLHPMPPDTNLVRLVAGLAMGTGFRVSQAATWAVTDNATLQELRRNMRGQTDEPLALTRHDEGAEFDAWEASRVIREIDAAGLDVRKYAIWEGRREICWELLAANDDNWQFFAEMDPDGVGSDWERVKGEAAARLESADRHALPALEARQVEVDISMQPQSRAGAWLAWYLRGLGNKVEVTINGRSPEDGETGYGWLFPEDGRDALDGEDAVAVAAAADGVGGSAAADGAGAAEASGGADNGPSDTYVSFEAEVEPQGRAIAEIVRAVFGRRIMGTDSSSVTLHGGAMDISVSPWESDEAEAEKAWTWQMQ
jgi:hypothetical protein